MERNENGYSDFNFGRGNRNTARTDEWRCPGTGDIWRGENGNMNGNMGGGNLQNGGGCLGGEPSNCSKRQLAMVYSPFQCWRMLYSADEALRRGTLFEELYKPLEDCNNG